MATFCIPKKIVDVLNTSALKNEIDLESLYLMDSKARRDFFSKYTDKETGKFINTKFEKAMVDKNQNAIMDWAQSVFTPTEQKKPVYKTVMDKIAQLTDMGVLNEKAENAFLEDLVTDKLGATITAEEMQNITEKAKKVEEAQRVLGDNLGNPEFADGNLAFFKALKDINDYMQSVTPANNLAVFSGTVGRGMMLFSLKSPILNVISNTIAAATETIVRRLAARSLKTTDNRLALKYIKFANRLYIETGYDIARLESIKDLGASGSRVLDDVVHSKGRGSIRAAGRFFDKVVFKWAMGYPDASFASAHFADSVNINAVKVAGGDKAKAREVMVDAMRVAPISNEGKLIRAQGILDAEVATWTNKSKISEYALGARKLINNMSGDLRVGDYLLPFVKTPANVVATSLDYAGGGFVKGLVTLVKAKSKGMDLSDAEILSISTDLARAGLGTFAAFILAWNTDEEDEFIGNYEGGRYQLDQLRNAPQTSFRLGDRWVSVDYLGPIAVPFMGIMYAKKIESGDIGGMVTQYLGALAEETLSVPGIGDIYSGGRDMVTAIQSRRLGGDEAASYIGEQLMEGFAARITPSIIADLAKALDSSERDYETALEAWQSKIPGLRNMLPEKKDIFGRVKKTENPLSVLAFGSRVKTDTSNTVIDEIERVVSESGSNINFTDWEKSTSKELAKFRRKIGEARWEKAKTDYGAALESEIKTTIRTSKYKAADTDDQRSIIQGLSSKAKEKVFEKYNFK